MKILRQTTTAYPTPQFIMGKTTAITSHINNIFLIRMWLKKYCFITISLLLYIILVDSQRRQHLKIIDLLHIVTMIDNFCFQDSLLWMKTFSTLSLEALFLDIKDFFLLVGVTCTPRLFPDKATLVKAIDTKCSSIL